MNQRQHLLNGSDLGFHEAFESNPLIEPEDDFWAWCNDCEQVWLEQGEWDDVVKEAAKLKVVCDQCYLETKRRNQITEVE